MIFQNSFFTIQIKDNKSKGKTAANEKKYDAEDVFVMILITLIILIFAWAFYWSFFINGPRKEELKLIRENERLMEEKERLLDREMLRSVYAHLHNEGKMLENLIKKTFLKVQSLDLEDDGLKVKPIAEQILKVIGK